MNIWYISKYASPAKYFFGTRHFYLAEEWVKTGNNVSVITSNSSHLSDALPKFKESVFLELINGVQTVWLNTYKSKRSSGISRIISWFHFDLKLLLFNKKRLSRPDAIIVSSLSLTTVIPAWILSRKYKCKFVFEVRDIWPLSIIILGGYSKNNLFIKMLGWIEKFGYERANLIVGTIPNLIKHVKEITPRFKECICIPQGLSTRFYEEEQQKLGAEYVDQWIPKDKFIICYAGTINVNNPLDILIKAAKLLQKEVNIHFMILGNGDRKMHIEAMAAGLQNVSFPPVIKKSQMNDLLSHVAVCYDSFESELAEFGLSRNKWIDYMYAEKPVICSYDGFKTMINEADCGTFVSFGEVDSLVQQILDYSGMPSRLLKEKGKNGRMFLLKHRIFWKLAQDYLAAIKNA